MGMTARHKWPWVRAVLAHDAEEPGISVIDFNHSIGERRKGKANLLKAINFSMHGVALLVIMNNISKYTITHTQQKIVLISSFIILYSKYFQIP
jgi:hypothetical protein